MLLTVLYIMHLDYVHLFLDVVQRPVANGPAQPPWRQIVGEEPQQTAPDNLTVRNPGPRQLPPRNYPALEYLPHLFSMPTILHNG